MNGSAPGIWSKLAVEWRLLLACVRHALGSPGLEPLETLARKTRDWELVASAARWHRLDPFVYTALSDHAWPSAPPSIRERLEQRRRQDAMHGLALAAALAEALRALREQGVRVLALKGPPLALAAYGDLLQRRSRDLDLLTAPDDLARALSVLGKLGYRQEHELTAAQWKAQRRAMHEVKLHSDAVLLELHWRFSHIPRLFPLPLEPWPATDVSSVGDEPVATLSLPDRFAYLCFHGNKHLWFRLFWAVDLAALTRNFTEADWNAAIARALSLKQRRAAALGLTLARDWFGASLPPAAAALWRGDRWPVRAAEYLARVFFERPLRSGDYRVEISWPRVLTWTLASQTEWAEKAALSYHSLIPPNANDLRMLSLPAPLYPLYYALRPLRLAGKLLFGRKRGARAPAE